jgi:hypothetical protein
MKVTTEYCRKRFLRDFARLSAAQQNAIIEAMEAIRDSRDARPEPDEPAEAPLLTGATQ